jgi:hypothetical protein
LDEQTELLREMRDLLLVIAEPALAKRDQARRVSLRETVGNGKTKNAKAVLLMDGKRTQAAAGHCACFSRNVRMPFLTIAASCVSPQDSPRFLRLWKSEARHPGC